MVSSTLGPNSGGVNLRSGVYFAFFCYSTRLLNEVVIYLKGAYNPQEILCLHTDHQIHQVKLLAFVDEPFYLNFLMNC